MKVTIIIPIYKPDIKVYEQISLRQLIKVLGNYDIVVIAPERLQNGEIENIFSGINCNKITGIVHFSDSYFRSPQTYNHLLKSPGYFKRFINNDFILMHHTDAFVFKNELDYWCNQDLDYIGAPLYEYNGTMNPVRYLGTGNGGFSLHKVDSALKVLTTYKRVYPVRELIQWYLKYNFRGRIRYLPYFMKILSGLGGNSHYGFNQLRLNEDVFWGILVPGALKWYNVPGLSLASRFSMEYNCDRLFQDNNNQLPFGCHQWYKGEFLNFWKPHIKQSGYEL